MTFGDFAELWVASRRTDKGSPLRPTVAGYRATLDAYLLPAFRNTPLRGITKEAVRTWYADQDQAHPRATSKPS